jgi:hypothetical protein
MILGPAILFMIFLWFFRKTRLAFGRCITCPEKNQRASVQFIARFGEKGPYRDVGSCSLLEGEKEVTCQKACLLSQDVLETPFVSEGKQEPAR